MKNFIFVQPNLTKILYFQFYKLSSCKGLRSDFLDPVKKNKNLKNRKIHSITIGFISIV